MEYRIRPDASYPNGGMNREWLLTNSLGDYASGTAAGCNTRRYHGLLAVQTPSEKRMLLSAIEDSVSVQGRDVPLSTRLHPGVAYPEGWRALQEVSCDHDGVTFAFHLCGDGDDSVVLLRSLMLDRASDRILIRYALRDTPAARELGALRLTLRPLISGRNVNHLHFADPSRAAFVRALGIENGSYPGFSFQPDDAMPALVMQVSHPTLQHTSFTVAPDWYYKVLYPVEKERGYDFEEDLLMPGAFVTSLAVDCPIWVSAGTEPLHEAPETLWERHAATTPKPVFKEALLEHLRRENDRFLITAGGEAVVPAGYHWFGPWGRDTFIALPGLTFLSGRVKEGKAVLRQIKGTVKNGLVPNLIGAGNGEAAFNSADASLWYILAVHRFALACPKEKPFIKRTCWPVIKDIIHHFAAGTMPDEDGSPLVYADKDGLLHTGSEKTQLTWMDASIEGVPVTPRDGCAVELNALWFDALSFAAELAAEFGETPPAETALLPRLKKAFNRVFRPSDEDAALMGGGLYDTWHPEKGPGRHIRPNQIFAVAVPCSPLAQKVQACVVKCVRDNLLTAFGLRTLAPSDDGYRPVCRGPQNVRDKAYHQGTVWPWLLGAYMDAVVKTARSGKAVFEALSAVTPLFSQHLCEAGLGSISEIFDGQQPHAPGGCIAQAWSSAEALRLLLLVRQSNPGEWKRWLDAFQKNGSELR
ncbi:amylo-alpha-1,6-glucosidase [uncultured Mailhella sp.]|uniref:amylo-alpha-1,6-glucosidase n=1 Tax=uncultured Mailhella sp. TaxID=1981031 RepID=UPI0025E33F7B|nr:amylo-alpha-1,6-glucosidase [uncultured Mailhella sp.]